jgi:hypothetical protein
MARPLARREHRSIAYVVERALEAYEFARRGASRHPSSTRALRPTMAAISIWRSTFAKTGRSIQDRSFDLPRHQRHIGNAAQDAKPGCDRLACAQRCRAGIANGNIAEIAFGIGKNRPDQRAARLEQGLASWRHRFADRIFRFTEAAALAYGDIISTALRRGRPMPRPTD